MANLDSILKSRDITLPTKGYIVKPMVYPVVMYGCVSWTIKKAEYGAIDSSKCGAVEAFFFFLFFQVFILFLSFKLIYLF